VPNAWFGAFDDVDMKPIIQVSLDGSYGRPGSPVRVFAYAGLFGYEEAWKVLASSFRRLMPDIPHFRTNELRDKPGFVELRQALAEEFVRIGMRAVGFAANEALLSNGRDGLKKRDVFLEVVKDAIVVMPQTVNLALLCDREQDLAKEAATWLDREQMEARAAQRVPLYERISGICYLNSRMSPQIQAADLVVGLLREHAEVHELDRNARMNPALEKLAAGRMKSEWLLTP